MSGRARAIRPFATEADGRAVRLATRIPSARARFKHEAGWCGEVNSFLWEEYGASQIYFFRPIALIQLHATM